MDPTHCELQSFTCKYAQLLNVGFNPSLSFKCDEGRLMINLSAIIDYHGLQQVSFQNMKRSRLRRRRQRQHRAATADAVNCSFNVNGQTSSSGLNSLSESGEINQENEIMMDSFGLNVADDSSPQIVHNDDKMTTTMSEDEQQLETSASNSIDEIEFGDGICTLIQDLDASSDILTSNTTHQSGLEVSAEKPPFQNIILPVPNDQNTHTEDAKNDVPDRPLGALTRGEFFAMMDDIVASFKIQPGDLSLALSSPLASDSSLEQSKH